MLEKLSAIVTKHNSLLSVGLDSDIENIPPHIKTVSDPQYMFNRAIIDHTYEYACAFKLNTAFYEQLGVFGIEVLKRTCDYIKEQYVDSVIIVDAKRGDIGNTNNGYGQFVFDYLGADAVTLNPYLGKKAMMPFLAYKEKGCIFLCRTSNEGAEEFQHMLVDGVPLYQKVAEHISHTWNEYNNCLLVVGATAPEELKQVRSIVGDMTLLIPGIGAQGGDIKQTVKAGKDSYGKGMIIAASRSIIFASDKEDFGEQAGNAAKQLQKDINQWRN
jgi:orotidine-5'-phosphate decarboxylase